MSINEILDRKDRPAYVRFERRPVEDREATNREGRYVAKDLDFALVTPPYSKDCVEHEVKQWFENLKSNVKNDRIPISWLEQYTEAYRRWQNGQEMPLNGTPILGWGVISPAHQQNLISARVMTVEDLANANDEGVRRIGMGAMDMREKARAWLKSMNDHGGVAIKIAALEADNKALRDNVHTLIASIETLKSAIVTGQTGGQPIPHRAEITLDNIMDDDIIEAPAPTARKKKSQDGLI